MTDDALGLALQQGAGITVASLVPLMLAAAGGALLASALSGALGSQDQTPAVVARNLATLGVVLLLGAGVWTSLRSYASQLWGGLHEVQHGQHAGRPVDDGTAP